MRMTLLAVLAPVVLVLSFACGGGGPAGEAEDAPMADMSSPAERFAGAWALVKRERRGPDGELAEPTVDNRIGYIIYHASGYMGVTTMNPGREPYSEGGPTAEEALAQMGTYNSYFGRFSVNEDEGYVTHHLEGALNPSGAGSDYQRFFTFSDDGNTLTLQPPPDEDGVKSFITWEKLPDLPESALTETHRNLFGFYRLESLTRATTDGEPIEVDPYQTAFIIYAPSGHMAVHLMRPDRMPYAGDEPTAEEALATVLSYGSYFGPFSVNEAGGYLVHNRIGNEDPGQSETNAQRFYELSDTQLRLQPPVQIDEQGREVQGTIVWNRISD